MADRLVGRVKTYGKHAAGVVISTDEPLTGRPAAAPGSDEGQMVTQFDMDALEAAGLRQVRPAHAAHPRHHPDAIDLIRATGASSINVYDWKEEYPTRRCGTRSPTGTPLGIFQIETRAGTRLTKRFRPAACTTWPT
jgi:DNA polymerase-3 subunit alpha